jgi:predicted Zn finger-like uncharacterized protein
MKNSIQLYLVKCDACEAKYRITDISKINMRNKFRCKICKEIFTVNTRSLKVIKNLIVPLIVRKKEQITNYYFGLNLILP